MGGCIHKHHPAPQDGLGGYRPAPGFGLVETQQGNVATAEYFHSAQREGAIRDATEMAISRDSK